MKTNPYLFTRKTEDTFSFVCNRENGQWVLSEEKDLSKLESLLKKNKISNKKGKGTAMVLLNLGRPCNLSCSYCHVSEEKTTEMMSFQNAKKSIDRIAELNKRDRNIIFHGSEPLLNFPLLKEAVLYGKTKGIKSFGLQTNGTLLDDEKLNFFAEHKVGVGVSLDGLRRHQDATRPYIGGKSNYDLVTKNIQRTIDKLGGVFVITVVSDKNVNDLEEISEDFENKGIGSVRFSPLYPTLCSGDIVPDVKQFTKSMIAVFDRYLGKIYSSRNTIKVSNFQEIIRTLFSPKETLNCVRCSGGIRQPLMGIDIHGEIYPCDFFWGRKEYQVGNINSESIQEAISSNKNFRNYRDISSLEDCVSCDWKTFCGSGCPGSSVIEGKGIVAKDIYCEYNKSMFDYVVSKLPKLYERSLVRKVLED